MTQKARLVFCKKHTSGIVHSNSLLCRTVSDIKLGNKEKITFAADEIIKKIFRVLPRIKKETKGWAVVSHPSIISPAPADVIADIISQKLKISRIYLGQKNIFKKISYSQCSPSQRRAAIKKSLYYQGKSLKGKNIILIDDVCATASAIYGSTRYLKSVGAKSVHAFVFLRINPQPSYLEEKIAGLRYHIHGKKYIIEHINNQNNILASKLLRIIFNLSPREKEALFSRITNKRRVEIKNKLKKWNNYFSVFNAKHADGQ